MKHVIQLATKSYYKDDTNLYYPSRWWTSFPNWPKRFQQWPTGRGLRRKRLPRYRNRCSNGCRRCSRSVCDWPHSTCSNSRSGSKKRRKTVGSADRMPSTTRNGWRNLYLLNKPIKSFNRIDTQNSIQTSVTALAGEDDPGQGYGPSRPM